MLTRNLILTNSYRAITCAVAALLCACGGGGGGGASTSAAAASPSVADAATQPAASSNAPVAIPSPPDMSIVPPSGADTTQASATAATQAGTADASTVVVGTAAPQQLPPGATPCQPSLCPSFDANGSVTNVQGTDNPTQAHGYVIASSPAAAGAYPNLSSIPTMILPSVPVSVGQVPK